MSRCICGVCNSSRTASCMAVLGWLLELPPEEPELPDEPPLELEPPEEEPPEEEPPEEDPPEEEPDEPPELDPPELPEC